MRLKRLITKASLLGAVAVGSICGLALAAASEPIPAFSFYHASIISWRGNGETLPNNVATAGWAGPMFYTTAAEGATPSGSPGRYPTGRWAPGDSVTRVLTVKNIDCDDTLQVDQLQIRLTGDSILAPKMALVVGNAENQILYSGTLENFAGQTTLPLAAPVVLPRGSQKNLTFTVSLDRAASNTYQNRLLKADIIVVARQVIHPLVIDVHPSSWPNPINPGARGNIPVAVNGSAGFDVRSLDWRTARFGPGRAEPLRKSYEDWNGDGYEDLMLKFDNRESGFACGMTEAVLTISSNGGELYEGSDPIVTPPCR